MDLSKEYRTLHRLAAAYDTMSAQEQRAYNQRLGAWMLAADIAADYSLDDDVAKMRQGWACDLVPIAAYGNPRQKPKT